MTTQSPVKTKFIQSYDVLCLLLYITEQTLEEKHCSFSVNDLFFEGGYPCRKREIVMCLNIGITYERIGVSVAILNIMIPKRFYTCI